MRRKPKSQQALAQEVRPTAHLLGARVKRAVGDRTLATEEGEVGIGIMLAITLTLIVAVGIVHIFMFLYGQAVVRSALDEGVRAGSRVDARWEVCEMRANEVKADLLGGKLGDGVTISCAEPAPGELVAVAAATFSSPLPGVPSWTIRLEATATQETDEP